MNKDEYMPLTAEDKVLGVTTPRKKTELEKTAFDESTKYEVHSVDKDNISIMDGRTVGNFLPLDIKKEIMAGAVMVEYNEIVITRKETKTDDLQGEEKKEVKPRATRRKRIN